MRTLILSLLLVCGSACGFPPVTSTSPPPSNASQTPFDFDRDKARTISDLMVDALIKNDRPALRSKMEKTAREYYDQAAFDGVVDMMISAYGKPIEARFKKAEQGRKWGTGGYDKPMLKHWYSVKTSNYDFGSHYIFVEIVPDEDAYASSGVSIVNFPIGVPEDMQ